MTALDTHLDSLFAPYPDSPRLREARGEVRTMMEDEHQALLSRGLGEAEASDRVIAEFSSLEEIAPELGITGELTGRSGAAGPDLPVLDTGRARAYANACRTSRWMTAVAMPLFVLSPVPLLLIVALDEEAGDGAPSPIRVAAGIAVLALMVALGIVLLVVRGNRLRGFRDVTDAEAATSPEVLALADDLDGRHARGRVAALVVGIVLWISSAVPVIVVAVADPGPGSVTPVLAVCLTLLMVAAGLAIVLPSAWSAEASVALRRAAAGPQADADRPPVALRVIAAVYWPVALAIYLAWSFGTGAWDHSWLVFAVAGVLWGALWGLNGALSPGRDTRRAS